MGGDIIMAKFHISKNGLPALCKAEKGKCPLGDNKEHFSSLESAQIYADKVNEEKYGLIAEVKFKDITIEDKIGKYLESFHSEILRNLNSSGHQAYIIGGSIRDNALDMPSNDVDIATSATPEETIEVFNEYEYLTDGNEHGTVPIIVNGEALEITTFRQDGEYSDGRRPDKVTFTKSLEEDVMRRDFTINAIAYNEEDGIVDLVGGVADIENRIIRTIGDPDKRFKEDPLRMMRGLRFASTLGFNIDNETEKAIINNKDLLKNVSSERLQSEFNKLIKGQSASEVLTKYPKVISTFIPEIEPMIGFDQRNPNHIYDVWEHTAVVVQNSDDDLAHKLAGVFHDIGKPSTFTYDEEKQTGRFFGHAEESVKIADKAMRNLKYENNIRERVLNIIEDHDRHLSQKPNKIKVEIFNKGPERYFDMINFKRADDSAKNPNKKDMYGDYDKIENIAKEYLKGNPILSHKDLAIKPKDIVDLGYKGPEIGEALNQLSLLAISGHKNERESQINHLKKNGIS